MTVAVAAQKPIHETHAVAVRRRRRRRRPHPRAARPVGVVHRSRVPRSGAAHRRRRERPGGAGDRRAALDDVAPRLPVDARGDGRPRPRRHAEGPGADVPAGGAVRLDAPARAHRGARRRAHRHRHPLHDRRPAVGGRGARSGAGPGLHEGLQPLDLRVLRRRAAPRPDRPPVAQRRRRRGPGAGAGRRRGRQGRLRRPVPPRRPAARPPRQRRAVRRRPGPRRAAGDPPDVRAAVDEGHPHGDVGERQAAPAAGLGGRRPTACATSSRRCSTTACSTSSRS